MNLARIAFAILFLLIFNVSYAQEIPNHEPDATASFDRMANITWFTSESFISHGTYPGLIMSLYFGCNGELGAEEPCAPDEVIFQASQDFSSSNASAFDNRNNAVYFLADGNRLQGAMRVQFQQLPYGTNPTYEYKGYMPIKISALRQIAQAGNVEMRVGNVQFTLSREDIDSLASFYNFAILNRRTPATNTTRTPARRIKRRAKRP